MLRVSGDASCPARLRARREIPCDFFVCHYEDKHYNATKQRFWMQYHRRSISTPRADPNGLCSFHLVRPTAKSQAFAKTQELVPCRQWVYLCHNHKGVFVHAACFTFNLGLEVVVLGTELAKTIGLHCAMSHTCTRIIRQGLFCRTCCPCTAHFSKISK